MENGPTKIRGFNCGKCGKRIEKIKEYYRHVKKTHLHHEKIFKCEQYSARFDNLQSINDPYAKVIFS